MELYVQKVKYLVYFTIFAVLFEGCNDDVKKEKSLENKTATATFENNNPDCVEYVALWSSGDIAERIGKDKKWVFLNYTIDQWDIAPTEGEGNVVGKLKASSYARIIEQRGDDYMVENPMNQVHGWISKKHVKTTSWKNPKTRKLCK